ncbi:MAG: hypothetical protein JW943_13175 [Deltaproteobacteria bacterium]|nr:hypothetical protein [Deltaproteobacteria bacterium]
MGSKTELTSYHKPCYTGRDISRWVVSFNERFCYFNRKVKRGGCWDESMHFAKNKLLLRQVGHYPEAAIDTKGYAVLNTAFMVVPKAKDIQPKYLLAVLNSPVVRCFWTNKFKDDRETFPKIKGEYLKKIPIPKASNDRQTEIGDLVNYVLAAKNSDPEMDTVEWEQKINQLVYELYGLTEEEIAIMEDKSI